MTEHDNNPIADEELQRHREGMEVLDPRCKALTISGRVCGGVDAHVTGCPRLLDCAWGVCSGPRSRRPCDQCRGLNEAAKGRAVLMRASSRPAPETCRSCNDTGLYEIDTGFGNREVIECDCVDPESSQRFGCPQCGLGIAADEDGLCATCGATCFTTDTAWFAALTRAASLDSRAAYASGYYAGHNDTVEGCFTDDPADRWDEDEQLQEDTTEMIRAIVLGDPALTESKSQRKASEA